MALLTSELKTQLALVAAVSASHMSMPNHWLPYSLVARAQNWSLPKTLFLTFLGALGHVSITLLVMLLISEITASILNEHLYRFLSSSFLLAGGLYYLHSYFVQRRRDSCCPPDKPTHPTPVSSADAPAVHHTAAMSLVLLTSLSPCVGSMPVLLAVLSPPLELVTVLMAALTLLLSAAGVMMGLVAVSYLGAASLDFTRLRRHERFVMGASLVLLAVSTFFVFSNHDHHHHGHGHDHHGGDLHAAAVHDSVHGLSTQSHHHHENGNQAHAYHGDVAEEDGPVKGLLRRLKTEAVGEAALHNGNQ